MCLESGPWIRLHECGRAAKFFGRTGENRFDAPAGEYGVLYVVRHPNTGGAAGRSHRG